MFKSGSRRLAKLDGPRESVSHVICHEGPALAWNDLKWVSDSTIREKGHREGEQAEKFVWF
jgi:hypothetical protein